MRLATYAFTAGALFLLAGSPSIAQQYPGATGLTGFPSPAPGVSVYDRGRPEFESTGFIAGDFTIMPSVTAGGYYDSNIFATDTGEVGSFVGFLGPQIEARTDQGNYSLIGLVGAGLSVYDRDSNQNAEEFIASVRGDYRFTSLSTGTAALEFRRLVVDRDDVDDGGGSGDPRILHRAIGRVGYSNSFGGFIVDARARTADFDFQLSEQRTSDRRVHDGTVRLGYRVSRVLVAFVEPGFEVRDYDTAVDGGGLDRDADSYGARAGATYELGDRLTAEASVGGARWKFDESTFSSENTWTVDGNLGWNVTPLTTLKVGASRDEVPTTTAASSLREVISVNAGAEHEFRRDIISFVDVEFRNVNFNRAPREDDDIRVAVGGQYFLSKMFSFTGKYVYTDRDSNTDTADFSRDIVWLGVQAQF